MIPTEHVNPCLGPKNCLHGPERSVELPYSRVLMAQVGKVRLFVPGVL
jgi:hypothetical protein